MPKCAMNKRHSFIFLVLAVTAAVFVVTELAALFFIPADIPLSVRLLSGFMLPLSTLLFFPGYKRLDSRLAHLDKSKLASEDKARRELESAGKVPLLAMLLWLFQTHIFCISYSTIVGSRYGLVMEMTVYGFISIALAYLALAAIYICSDVIVSRALAAQHITKYPLTITYKRQFLKTIIIPTVAVLMGVTVAISAGLSSIFRAIEGQVTESFGAIIIRSLPLILPYVACMLLLMLVWARNTSRLYASATVQLDSMLSDEKDLASRVEVSSVDEIAAISARINKLADSLHGVVRDISGSAGSMEGVGARLSENASSIFGAISSIAKDIGDLYSAVEEQSASVTEASSSIVQVAQSAEALAVKVESQSAAVSESSAAVQEMMSNISAISGSVTRASESLVELKASAADGRESIGAVQDLVSRLTAQSDSLLERPIA